MQIGDTLHDVVGPLGNPTDLSKYESVLLVGGGIGWYRAPSSNILINNVTFIGNYAPYGGAVANVNAVVIGLNLSSCHIPAASLNTFIS